MTKIITTRQMRWLLLWAGSSALVSVTPAIAGPVAIDGSTNTTVLDTLTGLPSDCSVSCLIQGSDQAGGNLFHSLSEFNVPSGVTVTFDGTGAERILSRVTGMTSSQIDGLLQVQGNADLFLLNPAGIVISSTGRLDLQGSFISSTAEQLEFQNGDIFPTLVDTPPILSISVPSGLQFGTNNTAAFQVEGDSSRPPLWQPGSVGKTFALVADTNGFSLFGDRSHELTAGGMVLGNVGVGNFSVQLLETSEGWDFDFSNVPSSHPISIGNASLTTLSTNPGGTIEIYGDLTLADSEISLQSDGASPAGNFEYSGGLLEIVRSNIESQTSLGGGDINLSSLGNILIQDNSLLSVQSDGMGAAGNISLNALGPDGIKLEFSNIRSTVESAGGNISLIAPNAIVLDSGNLIASTLLDGANVLLETRENLELVDENFISLNSGDGINSGMGGNLSIEALQVISVRLDTDIKVVGPTGNFQTEIRSSRPFRGFANPTFTNVIRDNNRSEIQITSLPPFPPPSPNPPPVPTPDPPPIPVPIPLPPPTLTPVPTPIDLPTVPVELTPVIVTVLPIPPALPVAPSSISPPPIEEEIEESEEEGVFWIPSLLPNEEEGVVALGNAYRIRRSRCAEKGYILNQGYLAVTGRGGIAESPGSSLLQSSPLADLGHSDFSWVSWGRSKSWIQPDQDAATISSRSQLVEAGSWSMNSGGNIQLVARGRVNRISAVQPCQLEGKKHDT